MFYVLRVFNLMWILMWSLGFGLMTSGCYSGGKLTDNAALYDPQSTFVPEPTITSLSSNPFYSKTNLVTVSGLCATGYTVFLKGAIDSQQQCVNATYSFNFSAATDGLYTFLVSQMSPSQALSKAVSTVWVRKSSIAAPVLTTPSVSPFFSAQSTLVITGQCESGAVISLSGDGVAQTTCLNSTFTLSLPKSIEGDYNLTVAQTDAATNTASTSFVWKKRALVITPLNPFLVVRTAQVFTVVGGSGVYSTMALSANNSGATFNSLTNTYTAGPTAGVTDTFTVTDSVGTSASAQISTVAGAADHLELDSSGVGSGDAQFQLIGQNLPLPMRVKVTDEFGNGIANFPVYARVLVGDLNLTTPSVQFSDLNGYVQYNSQMGYSAVTHKIKILPLGAPLPDVAGSSHPTLTFTQTATFSGTGRYGAIYSVGASPGQIATADFNGDGLKDIAVISAADNNVNILINKGNFLFESPSRVRPICSGPSGLVVADFNGDGFADIAIVCSGSDMVSVVLGNGDGTFQPAINFSTGAGVGAPTSITAGDYNHDGKIDLAVSSVGGAVVAVYNGLGDGHFAAGTTYSVGQSPGSIISVDLNKDSWLDLVVVNTADSTLSVLRNNQAGGFLVASVFVTGLTPTFVLAKDFNNDGYPDLAVINNGGNTVSVFMNDTTGDLILPVDYIVGLNPIAMAAADVTGDSKIDLIVTSNDENSITTLVGDGTGVFAVQPSKRVIPGPLSIVSEDLNSDGSADLVVAGATDSNVQIVPSQANNFMSFTNPVGANPVANIFADFNGDGKMDMAVVSSGTNVIKIYLGKGNGLFDLGGTLTSAAGPVALAAADLNKDGKIDLIAVNSTAGNVRVFLGNGDGTFQAGVDYYVGLNPSAIIVKDFNNDQNLDLAVVIKGNNRVGILLGNGDGTFGLSTGYLTGDEPTDIVASDFNGDGQIDLAMTSRSSASVSILIGNGDGTFQSYIPYAVGFLPNSLVAGDFNNDGLIDLAVSNENDSSVSILLGYGDGGFSSPNNYYCGLTPGRIVMGDFNGDGKVDLAVHNGVNQTVTLLFGSGNGQFNTTGGFSTWGSINFISTVDLNKDGAIDFVTLHSDDNSAHVWIGH